MQVLIAEDEQVSRHLLQRTLEKWDYDVVTVSNGSDAWEILRSKDAPRLAVLDWQMPGLDGVSLCRKVRNLEDTPYTYTILLTARSEPADLVEAMDAGADDFLCKPFQQHELEVRLRAGQRIVKLQEELIAARESLRVRATRDALTGLWNRFAIMDTLGREQLRQDRSPQSPGLGVLVADLDQFKEVNDTHGHLVGDEVLREVAQRMVGRLRRYDVVGRLGGEEFLVLLVDCGLEQIRAACERLRSAVGDQPIDTDAGPIKVTISIGATKATKGAKVEEVLDRADSAMYQAKSQGRNRVCCVEPDQCQEA